MIHFLPCVASPFGSEVAQPSASCVSEFQARVLQQRPSAVRGGLIVAAETAERREKKRAREPKASHPKDPIPVTDTTIAGRDDRYFPSTDMGQTRRTSHGFIRLRRLFPTRPSRTRALAPGGNIGRPLCSPGARKETRGYPLAPVAAGGVT